MLAFAITLRASLRVVVFGLVLCISAFGATPSVSQAFLEDTYLVDVRFSDAFSSLISKLRDGGYDLSGGSYVNFSDWYGRNWRDLQVTMMTQITDDLGLLWGLGTGERGEKYSIDPSLRLGFIWRTELTRRTTFSLTATTLIGGQLREKPCIADYGAIGGIQTVNCRLAATFIAPRDTLKYLVNESPIDRVVIKLNWALSF